MGHQDASLSSRGQRSEMHGTIINEFLLPVYGFLKRLLNYRGFSFHSARLVLHLRCSRRYHETQCVKGSDGFRLVAGGLCLNAQCYLLISFALLLYLLFVDFPFVSVKKKRFCHNIKMETLTDETAALFF